MEIQQRVGLTELWIVQNRVQSSTETVKCHIKETMWYFSSKQSGVWKSMDPLSHPVQRNVLGIQATLKTFDTSLLCLGQTPILKTESHRGHAILHNALDSSLKWSHSLQSPDFVKNFCFAGPKVDQLKVVLNIKLFRDFLARFSALSAGSFHSLAQQWSVLWARQMIVLVSLCRLAPQNCPLLCNVA